jgi:hypothetical protein
MAGRTRVCAALLLGLIPNLVAQNFTPTGSMNEARWGHTATLLSNGTVLVTGGPSNTAEIFDPQNGTWRYTLYSMNTARAYHTAVKLQDGRVLIAGGTSSAAPAEVFDPTTEQFTPTGPMNASHSASPGLLLGNGQVLMITGSLWFFGTGVSELYNPATNAWAVTPPIPVGVAGMAGVILPDGTVLALEGYDGYTISAYPYVERYDPSTDSVTAMANAVISRLAQTATVLPSGSVLIVAGSDASYSLSSTEIYDPTVVPNGQSQLNTSLNQNRRNHTATLLPNGDVLVAGGFQAPQGGAIAAYLASAELRDHLTGNWALQGPMSLPRFLHTATLLQSGEVLVAGGGSTSPTNVVEIWTGAAPVTGTINVTTNLPSATFTITGPATYSGSGTTFTQTDAPAGTYTITYGTLTGYTTPAPQSQNVAGGATIFFTGTYLALSSLDITPSSLTFSYLEGLTGPPPSSQNLKISSTGAALSFTAAASTTPSGGTWLSVAPTSGTIGTSPSALAVSIAGGLPTGTYNGKITVTAPSAANSPQTVAVTLVVSPPSRQITLTTIKGWNYPLSGKSQGKYVRDGEWQGQPPQDTTAGTNIYDLFYAIDACQPANPCNAVGANGPTAISVTPTWILTGSGFCPSAGCNARKGTVLFTDPQLNPITSSSAFTVWNNTTIAFVPSLATGFQYTVNTGTGPSGQLSVTIVAPDGVSSGPLLLPQPAGMPPNQPPWHGGVIATIGGRGYGQCTWFVANQLLAEGRRIPSPAYFITKMIDSSYAPEQWDVLDFGTPDNSTQIHGLHTGIITSPVNSLPVTNPNGTVTTTYSFTISEMNVSPPWGESVSSVVSRFVVNSSAGIQTQVYSDYCWPANHAKDPTHCASKHAIAYYRPPPN